MITNTTQAFFDLILNVHHPESILSKLITIFCISRKQNTSNYQSKDDYRQLLINEQLHVIVGMYGSK